MNPPPCGSPPTRVGTTVFGCACADGCYGSLPTRVGTTLLRCHRREAYRFTPTRVGTTTVPRVPGSPQSVHPHARGDNVFRARPAPVKRGSPPRAWGQRGTGLHRWGSPRFTP